MVGGIGLLGGIVAIFVPDAPVTVVAVLIAVGLPVLVAGVALFIRARRALRAQHRLAAWLGGRRLAAQLGGASAGKAI
jgi:uncharacterized membrane protein HdeD (DUF308 family)